MKMEAIPPAMPPAFQSSTEEAGRHPQRVFASTDRFERGQHWSAIGHFLVERVHGRIEQNGRQEWHDLSSNAPLGRMPK